VHAITARSVKEFTVTLSDIIAALKQKSLDIQQLIRTLHDQPDLLQALFNGLNADNTTTKFGCEKVLRQISEHEPTLLYPHIDRFFSLLQCENTFIRCGVLLTIANLASVDNDKKIDAHFPEYFRAIPGPTLIPAGTTIKGGAIIANAKPYLTEQIVVEILKVEHAQYATTECRNIACGHAIEAFAEFFDQVHAQDKVIRFVKNQVTNPRSGTAKKAEKFLKKFKPESL
jgi:hypothetical protein